MQNFSRIAGAVLEKRVFGRCRDQCKMSHPDTVLRGPLFMPNLTPQRASRASGARSGGHLRWGRATECLVETPPNNPPINFFQFQLHCYINKNTSKLHQHYYLHYTNTYLTTTSQLTLIIENYTKHYFTYNL